MVQGLIAKSQQVDEILLVCSILGEADTEMSANSPDSAVLASNERTKLRTWRDLLRWWPLVAAGWTWAYGESGPRAAGCGVETETETETEWDMGIEVGRSGLLITNVA
ncbi:hypothetical protein E4U43_003376 [Claviceps pusilla]|uniref:Uncharacterized protein n=1 Tax=Claviceps pusilla TaxID=123648 RepID=A0A9P7SXR3_9HYPO|nr:hypothetical protein E4U43_003376 [Claviceps pusilla]